MAEEEQDKTEDATPFKLREAKRRGQVAKSLEFNSFMVILTLLAILAIWAKGMLATLLQINTELFSKAAQYEFDIISVVALTEELMLGLLWILAPLLIAMVVVSVLMNLFQTGPIFSFFPIKPDIKRLNPVSGFKRVFSKKMLFEALKNLIKIAFFSSIIFVAIRSLLPKLPSLMNSDPDGYVSVLLSLVTQIVLSLAVAVLLIAVLDMLYTRWEFKKKMMMSRRELKDEIKRREGDPHIKSKIKEVQREAAKRTQSVSRVPEADVLITNPTHYAIAILYDKEVMNAPLVISKGAGSLAQKIKYFARKHSVPTIERKALAQYLFKHVEINQPVPEECYADLAKILVWAYARKGKQMGPATTGAAH